MRSKLFWLISFFTATRLLVALSNGLGVDEAHYVLYGLWPDLSYFDHPPLVGWVQVLFAHWPQALPLIARVPALASGALGSLLVYRWLRSKEFSEFQALSGVAALNLSLLFEGLSLFFLPDSLFLLLVPLLAIAVNQLEHKKTLQHWLWLGAILGLCGLSKYTAFLFVIALVIRWIINKYYRDVLTLEFWVGILLAALLVSPVLYWNYQHDWLSFKYQSGHVMNWQSFHFRDLLTSQFSQFIGLGFFYGWLLKLIIKEKTWDFERILIALTLAFLSFFAAFGNFLPHWTAPAFILGIPWGVARALKQNYFPRLLKISFYASSILWLIVHLELTFHILPANTTRLMYQDIQGWPEYVSELSTEAQGSGKNLAVAHWIFGSRFTLFSKYPKQMFVLDHRFDQFDLWNSESPEGKDFLIAVEPGYPSQEFQNQINCEHFASKGLRPILWRGVTLFSFEILECNNFQWKSPLTK
jgi:hypothetical protein